MLEASYRRVAVNYTIRLDARVLEKICYFQREELANELKLRYATHATECINMEIEANPSSLILLVSFVG